MIRKCQENIPTDNRHVSLGQKNERPLPGKEALIGMLISTKPGLISSKLMEFERDLKGS